MRIAMIGTGYVGLVSGACFSDFGHHVTCIDKDSAKIERLRRGEVPIFEPGLADLVRRNAAAGRLRFGTDLTEAVREAEVVFIAVGTPSRRGDGHADLSYVFAAAREIAQAADGFTVVVTKSTVPVGTGDDIEHLIAESAAEADIAVVSNPEFLREGAAIEDFKRPDRVVIGTTDPRARAVMAALYRPLSLNAAPILFTERNTSELIKYASNAFLAMKITFINEMADLCEKVGGNVQEVARGIGLDRRIGSKFLHAGPGYGGSCFPKDTLALMRTAQEAGAPVRLIETVATLNETRKSAMARRVLEALDVPARGATVAILGLTFKPNTDDMRDSPAINIVQSLLDRGVNVRAFDPEGMAEARHVLPASVAYASGPYECADSADCLVIVTEWDAFRALDLDRLKALLRHPTIVDLRNIYPPQDLIDRGFHYVGIGRGSLPTRRNAFRPETREAGESLAFPER